MPADPPTLRRERAELLLHLDRLTDLPMTALSFVWLALLIVDLTRGLGPGLQLLSSVIWGLFVLDFALSLTVAPDKRAYLRNNWLTALSLLLPALRVLRAVRALRAVRLLRATRSLNLVRLLTSLNRGLRAAGRAVRRRGVGYLALLTLLVALGGAAGMLALEDGAAAQASGLDSYLSWLWWTGMLLVTMGSDYFPKTGEGRALAWLLALYGFAVFGYLTASVASFFVGRDQSRDDLGAERAAGEAARADEEVTSARLLRELSVLRAEVTALRLVLPHDAELDEPAREA